MRSSAKCIPAALVVVAVLGLAFAAASAPQAKPDSMAMGSGAHLSYVMDVFCMNGGEGNVVQVMEKALNDKHAAKGQELVTIVPIMNPITRKDPVSGATISPTNCYLYYFKTSSH